MVIFIDMKIIQKLVRGYLRFRFRVVCAVGPREAAAVAVRLFCTPMTRNRRPAPEVFRSGLPVSMDVGGIRVNGYQWKSEHGPKAMILHGFESSCRNFGDYISALLEKGGGVIAFDAPGHGISEGDSITLPLYIKMIQQAEAEFGQATLFVSHSFGGIALIHHLEARNGAAGTRSALIAPVTESASAIDSFFSYFSLNGTVRAHFDKLIEANSGYSSRHFSIPRAIPQLQGCILWVHDKCDEITPFKDVRPVIEQNYPHVEMLITEGLGHKKIYRDPAIVKKVIDFLSA